MLALAAADWIVMALYAVVVLAIGWAANRRQKDSEDYFLAGRSLPWWVVGVSLIATSFSSVSLVGGTGFGFRTGMAWLQLQIGDLVALVVVAALFLPFFSTLGLTTAYEYLEKRFGVVARTVASALFIVQTQLRAALLVLAPALALSTVLGWSIQTGIVVTAVAAVAYSAFGGIGAVVWTDLIQMTVIVVGVTVCLVIVAGDVPGGFGAILDHAKQHGKLEMVSFTPQKGGIFNLLGALIPYGVLAMSLYGTGQQAVQRFLACRDLKSARRAALTGWVVGTVSLGITLFLGVCLAAWVQLAPNATPLEGDKVLPGFITGRLPAGLAGLMLAAIFAASMSSLDSAVHSTSTSVIVDFVRRFSKNPPGPKRELLIARLTTIAVGIIATLGALYAAAQTTGLLDTLVKWLGYFAGPLLGLFVLGMATKRATETGALVGVAIAFAAILAVLFGIGLHGWHPLWLAPFSFLVTVAVGYPTSLIPSRTGGSGPPGAA